MNDVNDEFLKTAWRKPSPVFASELREQLRELDAHTGRSVLPGPLLRRMALAASLLIAIGLLSFAPVRAQVAMFLDLFRVVNFAAVPVQQEHLQALRELDLPHLLGDQVHMLKAAGTPQVAASNAEAQTLAGMPLHLPAWQPSGMEIEHREVIGEQQWSVTASVQKLQSLLNATGIDDLTVPQEIDGQTASVDIPPVVKITYRGTPGHAVLIETQRPQASFPTGIDLPQLAEMGLRVLGLERAEANRFAQQIDWHTTLVVPVPLNVSSFRQVDVQGNSGLLIQTTKVRSDGKSHPQSQLLWSSGNTVFTLTGSVRPSELLEMAQSMQ